MTFSTTVNELMALITARKPVGIVASVRVVELRCDTFILSMTSNSSI